MRVAFGSATATWSNFFRRNICPPRKRTVSISQSLSRQSADWRTDDPHPPYSTLSLLTFPRNEMFPPSLSNRVRLRHSAFIMRNVPTLIHHEKIRPPPLRTCLSYAVPACLSAPFVSFLVLFRPFLSFSLPAPVCPLLVPEGPWGLFRRYPQRLPEARMQAVRQKRVGLYQKCPVKKLNSIFLCSSNGVQTQWTTLLTN